MRIERESKPTRPQAAVEVLELGQALFEAVIEAASSPATGDAPDEPFPTEDVRAAAEEFFQALRLLLGLEVTS